MSDIYYGSSAADATFTSGCDMGKNVATGGTETSKTSTVTGANNFAEIASQGGSIADVTAIPSTPTGKGWFYPLAGGKPQPVPGLRPEDVWVNWASDGRSAFVYQDEATHAELFRLDVSTGKRQLVQRPPKRR